MKGQVSTISKRVHFFLKKSLTHNYARHIRCKHSLILYPTLQRQLHHKQRKKKIKGATISKRVHFKSLTHNYLYARYTLQTFLNSLSLLFKDNDMLEQRGNRRENEMKTMPYIHGASNTAGGAGNEIVYRARTRVLALCGRCRLGMAADGAV